MPRSSLNFSDDAAIKTLIDNGTISFEDIHPKLQTDASKKVWNTLRDIRLKELSKFKNNMNSQYLSDALELYSNRSEIPSLSYLESYFSDSDWTFVWTNKIKEEYFFYLCSKKIFPITTYCRSISELDRSVYPDFVHDLWGHIPMLRHPDLFDFLQRVSSAFIKHSYSETDEKINTLISEQARAHHQNSNDKNNELHIDKLSKEGVGIKKLLSRLILFTFEFGIIKTDSKINSFEIFGGGILSSSKELENLVNEFQVNKLTMESLEMFEYQLHDKQKRYHEIDSLKDAFDILSTIEAQALTI